MSPQTSALAILYILAIASGINAAPIRRHDMTKRGTALKVVKRDSEDTLSPLARLLRGLSLGSQDNEVQNESSASLASQLGENVDDVVRLVMANPIASSSASAASVAPMVDIEAMESAYNAGVQNLPAPVSASASSSTAAPSALANMNAIEGDSSEDASPSAMVDVSAMEQAYQEGIAGLAKRGHNKNKNNNDELSAMESAYSNGVQALPKPSFASAAAPVSQLSYAQAENQLQTPSPASRANDAAVPSASASASMGYTRLGYQNQPEPVSAISLEASQSAPAWRHPKHPTSAEPSFSQVSFAHEKSVEHEKSADVEDAAPTQNQAKFIPIRHGAIA